MKTIVVGVDGSRESVGALRFALREARLHGDGLKLVAAWHVPSVAYAGGIPVAMLDDFEQGARESLADALEAVADEAGGVPVETVVRQGEAAHVLVEEAEGAAQLVVGCRDAGVLRRLLHHSVSGECSRAATCPVTVVHGGEPQLGPEPA